MQFLPTSPNALFLSDKRYLCWRQNIPPQIFLSSVYGLKHLWLVSKPRINHHILFCCQFVYSLLLGKTEWLLIWPCGYSIRIQREGTLLLSLCVIHQSPVWLMLTFPNELRSSPSVCREDCWKIQLYKSWRNGQTNKQQQRRQSGDGTVTSPTSHIIAVSVCSHWFLSLSEPAGCECLAHNETGKTGALDSHWSADGRHRGISCVLQSAAPELCAWVSVSVWFHILCIGSPLAAIKVASTLPGVHTQF